jgi:short subunit dehydrogenase-like uncharacterized protein
VILGATGFTGQLAAKYMASKYNARSPTPVKWAIAGRSKPKLQSVRDSLGEEVDMLICDLSDLAGLELVVKSTTVVANYAGTPFVDKALPVVELCAKLGTSYVDITGELPMHRAAYDKYHAAAQQSGAIVLCGCGFDSVPSDMGAFLVAQAMRSKHGCGCSLIKALFGPSLGGISGGTLATAFELVSGSGAKMQGAKEANARGVYALDPNPIGSAFGPDTGNNGGPPIAYDKHAHTWVAPFIMAATNAPVVRKSNAVSGYPYGRQVRYAEVMATKSAFGAVAVCAGLAALALVVFVKPLRALLFALRVLPKPGEGPSVEVQQKGFFTAQFYALGEAGKEHLVTRAHFNSGTAGDPGYRATALMSCESALCLALERDKCRSKEGGVLTTASALGDLLVTRLNNAGMDIGIDG